jgi:hypothetical protein
VHFYLAEDLALALRQRGVDAWLDVQQLEPGDDWEDRVARALRSAECFLLVASRQALRSPHVRAELAIAEEQHLPVVVALAERVLLPPSLHAARSVDVRQRFESGMDDLVDAIHGNTVGSSRRTRPSAGVFVTLALLLTALMFAAFSLGSLLVVRAGVASLSPVAAGLNVLVYGSAAVFCVWLAWEFARRRPRRTMFVLIAFATTAGLFVLLTCVVVVAVIRADKDPALGWTALVFLVGACAFGAAFLWTVRSAAFYRRLPTGDAPLWLRRRMLARRGHGRSTQPQRSAPIRYALRCHELDGNVAHDLERALCRYGHRPAEHAGADRHIVVVSNLTPTRWLAETLAQVRGRIIMVIAAPVPATALQGINRFQWIDHRRRRRDTLATFARTIGSPSARVSPELVPESLSSRVAPFRILVVTAIFTFSAMLNAGFVFARLAGVDPYGGVLGEPASPLTALPLLVAGIAMPASVSLALITRRLPVGPFLALFVASFVISIGIPFQQYPEVPVRSALPPLVGAGALVAFAWRQIGDWLPPHRVPRKVERIAAGNAHPWRSSGSRRIILATAAVSAMYLGIAALAEDVFRSAPPNPPALAEVVLQAQRRAFEQWFRAVVATGPQRTAVVRAIGDAIESAHDGRVGQAARGFARALRLARRYERAIRSLPDVTTDLRAVNRGLERSAKLLHRVGLRYRQAWRRASRARLDEGTRAARASDNAAERALRNAQTYWEELGDGALVGENPGPDTGAFTVRPGPP